MDRILPLLSKLATPYRSGFFTLTPKIVEISFFDTRPGTRGDAL